MLQSQPEIHLIQVETSYLTYNLTGLSQWLQKQISGSRDTTLLRFWFQFYNINDSLLNNLKFWQWIKTFLPCLRNSRLICIEILNKYLQTKRGKHLMERNLALC